MASQRPRSTAACPAPNARANRALVSRMNRRLAALLLLSTVGSIALACSGESGDHGGGADQPRVHGLTEEEAAQTLAKIGDHTITVGEFAEEIANKGPFLRTRYN